MPLPASLLLFTRYPEAGRCKTRLIPALGAEGAAQLHRRLTERMVGEAIAVEEAGLGTLIVHHHGASEEEMVAWLGSHPYVAQVEGELGWRMAAAFSQTFANGASQALLFGSDIPDLNAALLRQALQALAEAAVVIGPTFDGGYYLIGIKASAAHHHLLELLFTDIAWSTAQVLATTLERLRRQAIPFALLPTLQDIDTPDDLALVSTKGLL